MPSDSSPRATSSATSSGFFIFESATSGKAISESESITEGLESESVAASRAARASARRSASFARDSARASSSAAAFSRADTLASAAVYSSSDACSSASARALAAPAATELRLQRGHLPCEVGHGGGVARRPDAGGRRGGYVRLGGFQLRFEHLGGFARLRGGELRRDQPRFASRGVLSLTPRSRAPRARSRARRRVSRRRRRRPPPLIWIQRPGASFPGRRRAR